VKVGTSKLAGTKWNVRPRSPDGSHGHLNMHLPKSVVVALGAIRGDTLAFYTAVSDVPELAGRERSAKYLVIALETLSEEKSA
jgi:hypothetical protein